VKVLPQLAATLALLSLGVCVAVLTRDAHRFITEAELSLFQAQHVLGQAESEWQDEKADVHSIVASAQTATSQAALFATEQRAQLRKTSRDSDNQVRALGLVTRNAEKFFYNLDQQVNGHVLPDFDRELVSTSTAAQFSFESLTQTVDDFDFQLKDPEVGQTLHSFNLAAASLASASANGNSILGHADHVAAYYDKKLTTPLGFWKTMLHEAIPAAGAAGSIAAGFVR
jgi:hypothetical protein